MYIYIYTHIHGRPSHDLHAFKPLKYAPINRSKRVHSQVSATSDVICCSKHVTYGPDIVYKCKKQTMII